MSNAATKQIACHKLQSYAEIIIKYIHNLTSIVEMNIPSHIIKYTYLY